MPEIPIRTQTNQTQSNPETNTNPSFRKPKQHIQLSKYTISDHTESWVTESCTSSRFRPWMDRTFWRNRVQSCRSSTELVSRLSPPLNPPSPPPPSLSLVSAIRALQREVDSGLKLSDDAFFEGEKSGKPKAMHKCRTAEVSDVKVRKHPNKASSFCIVLRTPMSFQKFTALVSQFSVTHFNQARTHHDTDQNCDTCRDLKIYIWFVAVWKPG